MITIVIISIVLWLAYEVWRAPMLDDKGNIIQPTKKLRDLFKKK